MTHNRNLTLIDAIRATRARWSERRRAERDLRGLSEQSLDDIGMNRADVDMLIERI